MQPGAVILAYDYASRRALLEDTPRGELSPHLYPLCLPCANKLTPPRGWELIDRRHAIPSSPAVPEEDVSSLDERRDTVRLDESERRVSFGHGA